MLKKQKSPSLPRKLALATFGEYLFLTLWPLFIDGVQLPPGYSHFEEAGYFLPLGSQKFLVLILSSSEGWKAVSTLEPPSDFEHGTPGLGIQRLNPIANKVLNKGKSATRLLFNAPNSNLNDSGICLPTFPSRTNLKLHNIHVTRKLVKKPLFVKGIRSWFYSCGGSEEMWAWAFIHASWTLQYVFEGILFSRLFETTALLVFFLWLVKSLKNLWIIGLSIT